MDWRETMLFPGLILILMKTTACVDRHCRFNQSDLCNATVGDKLSLQILKDTRGVTLELYKGPSGSGLKVFNLKNNKETFHESIRNRCEFIRQNWTLIINSVTTEDSGPYRVEIYDSNGTRTSDQHLQVYIEGHLDVAIALGCVTVILILLIIIAYYIYKKKQQQLKPSSCKVESSSSPQQENKEQDIHYGEVTFNTSRTPQTSKTAEECVYAQVQTL